MCFLEDEICVLQRVAKTEERRPPQKNPEMMLRLVTVGVDDT